MNSNDSKSLGIQSVELGLHILRQIADSDKALTITEISQLCGMSKSKLHRYLTSFCRCGYLEKRSDLRYTLGSELILLGLRASAKLDIKEISAPYLSSLREQLNETVALALWSENGPFYIRWEESQKVVNIGIKAGSQVSVARSAPGRLFAAYLPAERTEALVRAELDDDAAAYAEFAAMVDEVRANGFAVSMGSFMPGISAISCPVFGQDGVIAAALTVVSMVGVLDVSPSSEAIAKIKAAGAALSRAIGYVSAD